jgi:carbamoyltransferase
MNVLGISSFYHNSSACLVRDGDIIAAAQEERFSRKKHDPSFPSNAISYCLEEGDISAGEIDEIVFYDKPFVKFERILNTFLSDVPRGYFSFLKAMPVWIKKKIWVKDLIQSELDIKKDILFTEHHESHAASAFFPSPFTRAAFLTMDGVGEWATASYGIGEGNKVRITGEMLFPHSIGLLYSAFTYYTGFKVNSGEYKMMGLAAYGQPVYRDLILDKIIDLKDDGSFSMDMSYFEYLTGNRMTNKKFNDLFGGPPRREEGEITRRYMDIAASIQQVTEEIILKMVNHVHTETGCEDLCLAGGVSLNCVANGRILREGPFKRLWIQPASGDAGAALGAALFGWFQYLDRPRRPAGMRDMQRGSCLGPSYGRETIRKVLEENSGSIRYRQLKKEELIERSVDLINEGKVLGWFQGRMEFGPRALGNRSIIADPRVETMNEIINRRVKFREVFRPFAPSVLREKANEYFEIDTESPYMLLVAPVRPEVRSGTDVAAEFSYAGWKKAGKTAIPAVTHVDNTARIHTVSREDNPLFYDLISRFDAKTGCPLLINTSFNVRGEPIVRTPREAVMCFLRTDMDFLVIGDFLVDKI